MAVVSVAYAWVCLVMALANMASTAPSPADCTPDMFGSSSNALWACRAQLALQRNWWPSPIAGLFSYQVWNGFDGFWQNGAVLETFANFMYYGNNTRYQTCVRTSLRQMYDLELAYAPAPSYDDMAWFGLSYIRIYEVLGDKDFLSIAKQIHDWNYKYGWDHKGACGGGYWFYDQKTTITNVQMLMLGAKLYRYTNDRSVLEKLTLTWKYIQKNGLIDPDTFQVSNIATVNCTGNRDFNKTFNSGVLVGALVEMYRVLNDTSYLTLAHRVAQATIFYNSRGGVLVERCGPKGCDEDELVYKGLFVRYLRYLMDVSDDVTRRAYSDWLDGNIKSVLKNDICWPEEKYCNITFQDGPSLNNKTGPVFDLDWRGPFNISNPMVQAEVFDLLVANIEPGTTCRGKGCTYDPPTPPPRQLTCADKPCPRGQPCCQWQQSYTCCETTQKCIKGVCT